MYRQALRFALVTALGCVALVSGCTCAGRDPEPGPRATDPPAAHAQHVTDGAPPPASTRATTESPAPADAGISRPSPTILQAPTRVRATATSETTAEVGWDAGEGSEQPVAYEILRDGRAIGAPSPALGHVDSGLEPWTEYCYTVRAVGASGRRSQPGVAACARTLDTTPPSSPGQLTAAAASDRKVDLRWSAASDRVGVAIYEVLRDGQFVFVGPGTSTSETGLEPAREYCYSVRALDAAGNASPERGPVCATTPDRTPPTVPQDLVATATSETEVDLSWSAATDDVGIAGYEIEREKTPLTAVSATRASQSGLRPWTKYCFTVRAKDRAGNRSPAAGPACATTLDVTAPSRPHEPRARGASETAIEIAWERSTDNVAVAGYEIFRDGALRLRATGTSAVESGLRAALRYCYTTRAYDAAGNRSEPSGPVCATTPDTTPPAAPKRLEAVAAGESRIDLRWQAATDNVGVAGYEVLRDDQPLAKTDSTRTADAGLRAWTEHCYLVRALDQAGNRSESTGPVCARTRDVTPPSPPARVQAKVGAPDRIDLRWDAATDNGRIAGYQVRRELAVVATVAETAASESGLRPAVEYCYVVTAVDAAGNRSREAAPVCATVPDVTPPSTPSGLAATPLGEKEIDLRWNASSDDHRVDGYEVLTGCRIVAKPGGTAAVVKGLRASVEYCYTVLARDASGNLSPESAPACATTPDQTPPEVPPAFAASAASDTEVKLRWRPATDNVGVAGYEVTRDGVVLRTLRETELADPGLKVATRYCYQVRAHDALGNRSEAAGPACVTTPDLRPPTAPSRLEVAAAGGKIVLGWSPSTDDVGVAGYEVVRAGKVVARVEETALAESGLAAKRWCYTVRALDAAGNRSAETEPACAVAPDLVPPSVPARLRVVRVTETQVDLRWQESTDNVGVAGYEVVRRGSVVVTSPSAGGHESGLAPANDYCWTARAFDASGNRSPETEPVCVRTPDLTPPTLEGELAATAVVEDAIDLRWPAATDNVAVIGYELERDGVVIGKPAATHHRDPDRRAGTRHCYAVRARDDAGNASKPLSVCVVTPDLTPPGPPAELEAAPTATQVALRWTEAKDNVGVSAYEVLRARDVIARVPGAVALDSGLSQRTEYCYSVRALDAAGNRSSATGPLCTKTLDPLQPPAPRDLAVAASSAGLELRWSASPRKNVVYRIYAGDESIGATRYLAFSVKAEIGRDRCFRVAAVDEAGRESPRSNEACAVAWPGAGGP